MRVTELWRFPVKSMQGGAVESIEVDATGADGDREWGVVDPAAGRVLSAKRWPDLLLASATHDDATGSVVVTLPDGREHEAGDPATDAALSDWLDHPVVLARASGDALPFEMHTDPTDDASDVFEWPGPPGRWVDLAQAHLLTTASLRAAAALHPDGAWDVRRFRPLALLDVEGDGFVEDGWIGAAVKVGGVTIEPFMPTGRCSMPTRAQPGLPRDVGVARALRDHHGLNLGVYGNVTGPGVVAVGDPVSIGTTR
jgi:uncharacterized protein YcbX